MQGKFKFSLDGADATARQFTELKRQVQELSPSVVNSVRPMVDQITVMYGEIQTLTGNLDRRVQESIARNSYTKSEIDAKTQDWNWGVLSPDRGGTGTGNAYENLFTVGPWRAAWVLHDGTVGTAQSIREVKTNICDADEFIPVDALRRVKWQVYTMKDDENQHLDDAQPMVGMIADDLDAVGLGFFCEYDDDSNLVGINYPMLGVAALRLAQQAMDEVDRLRGEIAGVSSGEDRMDVSTSKELIARNDS
nr:MAG: chaperone of endosialidase [Bacteriophage sp.]